MVDCEVSLKEEVYGAGCELLVAFVQHPLSPHRSRSRRAVA